MSSLIPPPLHAHLHYCIYLLSGPGSNSIFRFRAPGSDSIFRVRAPGSDSIFRVRAPGSDSIFRFRAPGSDSIFRVRAPGSDSFSRAPAPSVLPLSSPGSKCPSSLEPQLRLPKNPRSVSPFSTFCILPRIEYSSLQFHFDIQQNDISSNVIIMY